ncbi:MAG: hypothetical protein LBE48_03320 [Methanomassiliicoccaceae archaeon]|jgi:hypothetical protein|nr:hypothetical protein [Methanomassiliicoccaceae archaeon]
MAFCSKCGKDAGNNNYCRECGTAIGASSPSVQIGGPGIRDKRTILAVAVAIVIIIASGAGYFLLMEKVNSAEITVIVHSSQSTSVDVTVRVNDQDQYYEGLGPGQSIQKIFYVNIRDLTLGLVLAVVIATDGGSGTVTDAEWIFVEKRGKYTVDLYI